METVMNEPVHPTYGTLDKFLAELGRDIRNCYYIRIGQQGAFNWYTEEFGRIRRAQRDADSTSGETSDSDGGKV